MSATANTINLKHKDNLTILIDLAGNDKTDLIKDLIAKGANVNETNNNGETALMRAVRNSKVDNVKLLLESGADLNIATNIATNNGTTALMYVADNYHNSQILDLLINHKANLNSKNKYGMTALMMAAKTNYQEGVSKLIEAGADINLRDTNNKTALSYARLQEIEDLLTKK
jgi:ankyrin repeat protein